MGNILKAQHVVNKAKFQYHITLIFWVGKLFSKVILSGFHCKFYLSVRGEIMFSAVFYISHMQMSLSVDIRNAAFITVRFSCM
jgi:hypothetical protein